MEALTFVNRDKSKQKHFTARGPKENHLSVIFSISTLCFTDSFLPSFCFKGRLNITSPLGCAFTKLSRLSITLSCHYSLPTLSPTVVDRWLGLFSWLLWSRFASLTVTLVSAGNGRRLHQIALRFVATICRQPEHSSGMEP